MTFCDPPELAASLPKSFLRKNVVIACSKQPPELFYKKSVKNTFFTEHLQTTATGLGLTCCSFLSDWFCSAEDWDLHNDFVNLKSTAGSSWDILSFSLFNIYVVDLKKDVMDFDMLQDTWKFYSSSTANNNILIFIIKQNTHFIFIRFLFHH